MGGREENSYSLWIDNLFSFPSWPKLVCSILAIYVVESCVSYVVTCCGCRGFAVGIYTTNSPQACQYVAGNCDANIIVVENDVQLQKILKVRDQLPHLKAIIMYQGDLKEDYPNVYTVCCCQFVGLQHFAFG